MFRRVSGFFSRSSRRKKKSGEEGKKKKKSTKDKSKEPDDVSISGVYLDCLKFKSETNLSSQQS